MVGGGRKNTTLNIMSAIGGGEKNKEVGDATTVASGKENKAKGKEGVTFIGGIEIINALVSSSSSISLKNALKSATLFRGF